MPTECCEGALRQSLKSGPGEPRVTVHEGEEQVAEQWKLEWQVLARAG